MRPLTSALFSEEDRTFVLGASNWMSNFTWVHEGPPTRVDQTFPNLISSHQTVGNNASLPQALFQAGARKHNVKAKSSQKKHSKSSIMWGQHERISETYHPAGRERRRGRGRDAPLHSDITYITSQGRWSCGEWDQDTTLQMCQGGKINREMLFLCLIRANPTQLGAKILNTVTLRG